MGILTVPGCRTALVIVNKMIHADMVEFFNPGLAELAGSAQKTLSMLLAVAVFLVVQYNRKEEGRFYTAFTKQPAPVQYICIGVAAAVCLILACAGTATVNTQFIYFQF